jgi:hypothetical protein
VKTPIFGPFNVSRSSNLADNRLINLYPELVETKDGKAVGALYLCPGLTLKKTVGNGGCRGLSVMNGSLYAVQGGELYSLDAGFNATLLGSIAGGQVSMIDNGTQLAIFTANNGYLAPPGRPLTGASIGAGGTQNAAGDLIVLNATGGTQIATAAITVTAVDGAGAITAFVIASGGSFTVVPSGFTQASTTGAGSGLVLSAPAFGAAALFDIVLPFSTTAFPITAAYVDGFGLINQPGSNLLFQSDLLDLSTWPALQFGSASGNADNIRALAQVLREIWVIKEFHTEIWYDAGTPNFAFAVIPGPYLEFGIHAIGSLAQNSESLFWLAQNTSGERIVVQTSGHAGKRVSTHPLETAIQKYPRADDAQGFCYQQEGHSFYVLGFPSGDATWVLDITESVLAGEPLWHQRASFAAGLFHRHWAQEHVLFGGQAIVGDYRNGNLYAFDIAALTDAGTQRKWLRSWRALKQPSEEPVRFNSLRIDMQTGVDVAAVDNPQAVLRWSDDGGHTWSNEKFAAVGVAGETAKRVMFRRLGATRRNSGLDRIFELSSTDQFPVALIDAELDAA